MRFRPGAGVATRAAATLRSAMLSTPLPAVLALVLSLAAGAAQAGQGQRGAPFGGAMDDHFRRDAARGEGLPSRAFAFAAREDAAVVIARVDEQRQLRGTPRFVLNLVNKGAARVPSFEIAVLVVGASGQVRLVQPVPVTKALKAGQTALHEVELRGVTLGSDDRLAFVVAKVDGEGAWAAPEAELRQMAAEAAMVLFPRP